MALQFIVVGDGTSHGGRVITGSGTHSVGGKSIARLFEIGGQRTGCGCTLIGSGSASIGD